MSEVRAAILGFGRWGQLLHQAVDAAQGIRISHVVTRSPDKVSAYCHSHDLVLGESLETLLREESIEAIIIATPHSQHYEQLMQCAAAGKHVYCEKPFTLSGAQAREALSALAANRCKVAIGHNRRFAPNTLALQDLLSRGWFGRPVHIEGVFNAHMAGARGRWRDSTMESPAGGMTSLGIHALDMMIHLMGPVASLRASSRRIAADCNFDDHTLVELEFTNHAGGRLTTLTSTAMQWRITLYGTNGWAELQDQDTLILQPVEGERETMHYPGYEYPAMATLTAALEAFAADIRGGPPFPVTPRQIAHATESLEAIFRSATEGRTVQLRQQAHT